MTKKEISDWIVAQVESGLTQLRIAQKVGISRQSVTDLKYMKLQSGEAMEKMIAYIEAEKHPEQTLWRIVDQINNRVNGNAADINLLIKWFEDGQENIRQSNERLNANDTDIASLRFDFDRMISIVSNLKDELIPIRIRAERIENKTDLLRSEIDLMQEVDNHIGRVGKIRKFWRWLW